MILLHRTPEYENLIRKNKIKDKRFDKVFYPGSMWSTNYGECIVIKPINYKSIKIRFIDTGFITTVRVTDLLRGTIKDHMKPVVCNIGYLGEDYKLIKEDNLILYKRLHQVWHDMIKRCYDKNNSSYCRYGGIGVSVDKRWHNFSNFYYDVKELNGWDIDKFIDRKLFIDKDKYQYSLPINKRVYSKDTCCWLTRIENNSLIDNTDQKIKFLVIYPDGSEEVILGIREFAKKHNIFFTNISACLRGKQKTYKGMKFKNIE